MVGLQDVWLGKWILGQGVELWSAPVGFRGKRLARRSLRGIERGVADKPGSFLSSWRDSSFLK